MDVPDVADLLRQQRHRREADPNEKGPGDAEEEERVSGENKQAERGKRSGIESDQNLGGDGFAG